MKVCPHCAEELADETTVCTNCHKDPAVAPAWAGQRQPDEPSLEQVWRRDGIPPTFDGGGSARYAGLEPAGAKKGSLGIPSKVWLSLGLAFGWGLVLPATSRLGMTGLILLPVGYLAGLILGNMGRAEAKASDRLGQVLAIIAITLNAIRLAWSVVIIVPSALTLPAISR